MEAPSRSPRLMFALTAVLATAQLFRPTLVCDTTVAIGDGKIAIELRDDWAPNGAKRLTELAEDGFFTGMPFFRAIPNFLVQFGIGVDRERHQRWQRAGNIKDDPPPKPAVPFTDGIVSFAGYGPNSRSTHLFLTLGSQPGLGKSPWEVPVGRVVRGLDVMRGIYTGYGDGVNQAQLSPDRGAEKQAEYLGRFPKLDRIKSCVVEAGRIEL